MAEEAGNCSTSMTSRAGAADREMDRCAIPGVFGMAHAARAAAGR